MRGDKQVQKSRDVEQHSDGLSDCTAGAGMLYIVVTGLRLVRSVLR
jgi:hypothetical protein